MVPTLPASANSGDDINGSSFNSTVYAGAGIAQLDSEFTFNNLTFEDNGVSQIGSAKTKDFAWKCPNFGHDYLLTLQYYIPKNCP